MQTLPLARASAFLPWDREMWNSTECQKLFTFVSSIRLDAKVMLLHCHTAIPLLYLSLPFGTSEGSAAHVEGDFVSKKSCVCRTLY